MSPPVPVLADVVTVLPNGQGRWVFPGVPRLPYRSGQQEPCTDCAAAGRSGLGVSREGSGSAPLCLGCWRARLRVMPRRGRLTPEAAGLLAALEEELACPDCKPGAMPLQVDLPTPEAVQGRRHQRRRDRARHRTRPRPARASGSSRTKNNGKKRAGCRRCGDAAWLASAWAVHEADQARAAAEAERVDELLAVVRSARRRVARAQRRLDYVRAWQARVTGVFEALPRLTKTGSRGKLEMKEGPGRQARAVWLIADFCARMYAERIARGVSGKGRPPQHPLVVGVMAIAADPAGGRRSMEGLGWTAEFAGVTTRTVSSSRAYSRLVGSTVEVERGRRCSLAELAETGLRRRRSVWDFEPLHASPFDPEPFLGMAAGVVAKLLERAVQLVDERRAFLEEERAAVAAAEAELLDAQAAVAERRRDVLQLEAALDESRMGEAQAAFQEANAARSRATLAVAPRLSAAVPGSAAADRAARADRDRAVATVVAAYEAATRMDSFFHPPRSGLDKRSSSASRGLTQSLGFSTFHAGSTPVAGGRRPDGRGEGHKGGASRPSPTKRVSGRTTSQQPRTVKGQVSGSPAVPGRSVTMLWAKALAHRLAARWAFLGQFLDESADGRRSAREVARERGRRVHMIASTLGSRLSRYWTVGEVVRLVQDHGLAHRFGPRHVIAAGDAHSPLTYLARVLDRALTSDTAVVGQPSPVRQAWIAQRAAENAAAAAAVRRQRDAEDAERAAGYAAEQQGPGTARAAARQAALAGRGGPARRSHVPPVDDPARLAAAELAVHRGAGPAEHDDAAAWPATAQPGGGVPYGRKEPGDR